MNLKKTLVTGIAAAGLMASAIVAPVSAAPPETNTSNNSTNAVVQVASGGEFDVFFNSASFSMGGVTLNSQNPEGTGAGSMRIYYTDTLADRPNFNVVMSATDFDNINSGDAAHVIPASGFQVAYTYNVVQSQFGGPTSTTAGSSEFEIGDIGYFVDGAYVGQTSGGSAWTGTTNLGGAGTTVQFGYAGVGTISSYGDVDVEVEVPSNTVAGQYESQVTLTVIAGTQP